MDPELAAAKWNLYERVLRDIEREDEDDHSRYWEDDNIDEYTDALYGVV